MYTSTQIAELLGCTDETVRGRTKEFADFLSPTANPRKGRQRGYSEADLRVMSLINAMKNEGARFDDIRLALENGQLGDIPEGTPSAKLATQERGRVALLQTQLAEWQALAQQRGRDHERALERVEVLTEMLEKAQVKIDALNREIGRLQPKG